MRVDATVNRLLRGGLALAATLGGISLVSGPSAAYAADDGEKVLCSALAQNTGQAPDMPKKQQSPVVAGPLDVMGVKDAQEALGSPGKGVRVALIDSGVEGGADKPGFPGAQTKSRAKDYHGTVSAGLIEGIAPRAQLLDYPVLKVGQDKSEVMTGAMTSALQTLAKGNTKHLVVSVSLAVDEGSAAMDKAIKALVKKGAIVVASADWSGNHDSKDRDIATQVFPAAYNYDGVVTASASHTTAGDFTEQSGGGNDTSTVLPDSNTDIAAPVYGAAARTLFGQSCWVDKVTTGWAAAEVSAVLALIWSAYPSLSADEAIDRLYRTASGRSDSGGRFTGAGVVNAYAAVTRQLENQKVKTEPVKQAQLGQPPADVLASVRRHAVWWGIGGGGALALGLILRPLFSRRKNT